MYVMCSANGVQNSQELNEFTKPTCRPFTRAETAHVGVVDDDQIVEAFLALPALELRDPFGLLDLRLIREGLELFGLGLVPHEECQGIEFFLLPPHRGQINSLLEESVRGEVGRPSRDLLGDRDLGCNQG